ncbi:MAG: c-type cytochrome [Amphiplicatus sp.]|nr:c-type cytochrome [Amphiplicatus sp.]
MENFILTVAASLALAGAVVEGQNKSPSADAPATVSGDAQRGETLYQRRCGACHSIDQNRIGPKHQNTFGSKAGAVEGFAYSKALKELDVVWNEATLDEWLQNPGAMAPGTRMGFRLTDEQERADIIAYLRQVSEASAAETE